ncbi:hypothetical protein MSPP1_001368 [Malassezia sp. CBS 17886]|nr:hypothetical protein MSPP1_001368 [Malassezia sp. CBS 17886]
MPSSSFSSSEKSQIKSQFPSSQYKILTVTPARIYAAYPTPDRWYYTGAEGALALVRDSNSVFSFRLVDLKNHGNVAWGHELYNDFYYYQDKPFFHTFAGDECMMGLCFADDSGAAQMHKKVESRAKYAKSSSGSSGLGFAERLTNKLGWYRSSSSEDKRAKPEATPPENPNWNGLVDQLGSMGVSEKDIQKNEGFIRDFLGSREDDTPTSALAMALNERKGHMGNSDDESDEDW